ncbi:hypothetical protein CI109_107195 [Kwoniella shandongensis]|uniref:Uncharacterized protein n=1 Tax=Kwoniella shandongensis TaxID=1734106 RepID=A0A5M6C1Z7_9TREE|nr:uncharacterized protein CI109_002478 [Kwoniella shandongensis]KAA5529137.1 hypothetical protein CI109_002478 [Kwoniella shandongensis]
MLPTQLNNHHHHFGWGWHGPSPNVAPGVGAAAESAAAAAAAAATSGGGGMHPPGGMGYQHHYWDGYGRGYRRGRGGRPFFRRFVWLGIGFMGASWWYHHKQHKREELERYITDPSSFNRWCDRKQLPAAQPAAPAAVPVDFTSTPADSAVPTNGYPTTSTPSSSGWNDERWNRKWGWRACQEKKDEQRLRDEARRLSQQVVPATTSPAMASTAPAVAPTANAELKKTEGNERDEMTKLREAVEKLWEERKQTALEEQDKAKEKAREFARDKLEKLSVALETLRESLKQDGKNEPKVDEKKWV